MASTISAGTTSGTAIAIAGDTSGQLQLQTNGTTTAVTIDTAQRVGIGGSTVTDSHLLNIQGSAATNNIGVVLNKTNATAQIWGITNTGPLAFYDYTASAERMRIDSSGNALLGSTTNPNTAKLRVYKTGNRANIEAEQGDSGGYNFQSIGFNNGGTFYHCNFQEGTTQRGSISSNGSVTTYATTSDYRLKENIEPIVGALGIVSQLKPVTYDWTENKVNGQGFIAHELQEVIPDAVVGIKDAVDLDGNPLYQQIDTSVLVATLTAAIQEQQAMIIALQADVQALKATPLPAENT